MGRNADARPAPPCPAEPGIHDCLGSSGAMSKSWMRETSAGMTRRAGDPDSR